jgi:hypothetical protein
MDYMEKYKNKICVVISSCDKYIQLIDVQLHFFKKYWPNCPLDIFYITETKPIPTIESNLKIQNLITNIDPIGPSDWSKNLKLLLDMIQYEYIIYLQEDYIFTDFVDESRLDILLEYVIQNDVNYVRFYGCNRQENLIEVSKDVKLREISKNSNFRSSLMIAIWNKNTFSDLINLTYGSTPWQFESNNVHHKYDKFYCVDLLRDDVSDIIKFAGIYGSGNGFQIYPFLKEMIKNENIKLSNGEYFNIDIKL